ncbi:beta-1,3-glucosyltransferase-like [Diadema antillarum]|uniref:beta-1,3-glucosyltransferase-like n=1 Tax=Diadema antillarum TaxID=105358 RepID=UPI003A861179
MHRKLLTIAALTVGLAVCCVPAVAAGTFNPYQDFSSKPHGAFNVTVKDVLFVIRSQAALPHRQWAQQVRDDIIQQTRVQELGQAEVILLHEKYGRHGQWTMLPVLPKIFREYSSKKWFFFCEEDTRVSVTGLLVLLSRFSSDEEWFFGKTLYDQEATIIHHFHNPQSEFIFPDFDAGWILSATLLSSVAARIQKETPKVDFSIDVKHELALYIWNEEGGLHLTGLPQMCAGNIDHSPLPLTDDQVRQRVEEGKTKRSKSDSICVTAYPKSLPRCGSAVPGDDVLFAVKTCEKFHRDRVSVVKKTWGNFAQHLVYFSDKVDESIPTVECGVPNTERGHCAKTFIILEKFLSEKEYEKFKWLVIADDDTILSVAHLEQLLSCYKAEDPVIVGERYGYGHVKGHGYDYVTGGGGMVFSRSAVETLISNGCKCSKIDDPDDMIIGMCAKRYDVPIAHSPLFHQARPADYAKGLLSHQTPVSFHKHWNVDPVRVYGDWFRQSDEQSRNESHDEL